MPMPAKLSPPLRLLLWIEVEIEIDSGKGQGEEKDEGPEEMEIIQVLIVSILERESNAQYTGYRQYCIVIIKLAKRLDCHYSHHQKNGNYVI